ncbi:HAD-IIIA family hydrolase [Cloacibacillus sp. An23]|uniref:KdsC family phosphatase n=1 Tax=Cloacibacillus sp. An23 TaxID=1965591 RepID=UPI000B3AF44E|nr:HAD-IIIA family hydrolase [Cloacibacillus sp. An23]OUO92228.1 HAD family hydrolase [Cloacibacillus sp. An23]
MIKLFAMDVDGTLTDGGIYMDGSGNEMKRFDVQDGQGIAALIKKGVKVAFISGRYSAPTQKRAEDLKITRCVNGVKDKLPELRKIAAELGVTADETAYAGDDVPDVECIEWAGLGIAVANACAEAKKAAGYVAKRGGGRGAIRECAEMIIRINDGEAAD